MIERAKNWYKGLVSEEVPEIVDEKPVVGEVTRGPWIPEEENEFSEAPPRHEEPSVPATASMLEENLGSSEDAGPVSESLIEKCRASEAVSEGRLWYLEPGSEPRERVTVTHDCIKVGNVELRIDSEHVKIVAPDSGPVVITAKLRQKTRR